MKNLVRTEWIFSTVKHVDRKFSIISAKRFDVLKRHFGGMKSQAHCFHYRNHVSEMPCALHAPWLWNSLPRELFSSAGACKSGCLHLPAVGWPTISSPVGNPRGCLTESRICQRNRDLQATWISDFVTSAIKWTCSQVLQGIYISMWEKKTVTKFPTISPYTKNSLIFILRQERDTDFFLSKAYLL